jgi:hypothetical protein
MAPQSPKKAKDPEGTPPAGGGGGGGQSGAAAPEPLDPLVVFVDEVEVVFGDVVRLEGLLGRHHAAVAAAYQELGTTLVDTLPAFPQLRADVVAAQKQSPIPFRAHGLEGVQLELKLRLFDDAKHRFYAAVADWQDTTSWWRRTRARLAATGLGRATRALGRRSARAAQRVVKHRLWDLCGTIDTVLESVGLALGSWAGGVAAGAIGEFKHAIENAAALADDEDPQPPPADWPTPPANA